MSELVTNLRECSAYFFSKKAESLMEEAANEIEARTRQRDEALAQLAQARADDDRNNQLMVDLMRQRDELLAALEECKGWTHRAIELEVSFSMQEAQRSAITRAEAAIAAVKGGK